MLNFGLVNKASINIPRVYKTLPEFTDEFIGQIIYVQDENHRYDNYYFGTINGWCCLHPEVGPTCGDYIPVLYAGEGEEPTYVSTSLLNYYGNSETKDTKIIFEEVVKDFKMTDEDKTHLWKLLTDFSIDQFLNNEQDYDFLAFLWKYNFSIGLWI